MKPIHVQAEEMGLQLPLGCSAEVIRGIGYEISDEVMDCEIYTQAFDVFANSRWGTPTGFVWDLPEGSKFYMEEGPYRPIKVILCLPWGCEIEVPRTWHSWGQIVRDLQALSESR